MSVLNRFDAENDHRLIRARIHVNTRLERRKLTQNKIKITKHEPQSRRDEYNSYIERKLQPTEALRELEINKLSDKITNSIRIAVRKVCSMGRKMDQKLSAEKVALQERGRKINKDALDIGKQKVKKAIRRPKKP